MPKKPLRKEIRILGIDDSPFVKHTKGDVLVIGTVFRGGNFMDGLLSAEVGIDGDNSTLKLINMIKKSKFRSQLRAIMLDGIALAGFNIIDINMLHEKTKIPVMVIIRNYPNFKKIEKALKKVKNTKKKLALIKKAGKVIKIGKIYTQLAGITKIQAQKILKISCTHSLIPEAIRVAHLIASGIFFGESRGGA